ncbi:hypothetical protein [Nonomuraea pusilla]|uniref:Uncharacterized protein n=1 Tax=Nonomuraea pusilla TaxID=46177 RepID=A0A1H7YYB0_9ACTN|nr:hypothetical protein [Nonomuraea pusilla]SEM50189.1 hypothetical protein SAMN05660976_05296 [Nonomuraea pusilla]
MGNPPPAHQPPERKASKAIPLTVLGVLSVMLVASCATDEEVTADCVDTSMVLPDGSYEVVDDEYCDDDDDDDDGGGHSGHSYYGGSRGAYHWYYGGTRSGHGVSGGTTIRPADVSISSRGGKSIQRGGFGSHWGGGS